MRLRFLLLTILTGTLGCAAPDPMLKTWAWEGTFALRAPGTGGGLFRISRSVTNVDGRRLLATVLDWHMERMDRVESYMSEDYKTTILTNAGTTILSNRCVFLETDTGVRVAAHLRVRAGFRRSQDYRELIRKRLDELFIKHYGQGAAGRVKFVEEQLRATWKGELDSLPDIDLAWSFTENRWQLAGRINKTAVTEQGALQDALFFPFSLFKAIRQGGRHDAGLLLPWLSRRPLPVVLQVRAEPAGFSCTIRMRTNTAPLGTITVSTMFRPVSVKADGWLLDATAVTNTAPGR